MRQIERTIVASGIIGQYGHEWVVMKLYDRKYDSESYNLYINKEYIGDFPSVLKALAVLIDHFTE
jgi:hypothetical protein